MLQSAFNVFGYENPTDGVRGRTTEVEPFCGRFSLKNPGTIFHKGTNPKKTKSLPVTFNMNRYVSYASKLRLLYTLKGLLEIYTKNTSIFLRKLSFKSLQIYYIPNMYI